MSEIDAVEAAKEEGRRRRAVVTDACAEKMHSSSWYCDRHDRHRVLTRFRFGVGAREDELAREQNLARDGGLIKARGLLEAAE